MPGVSKVRKPYYYNVNKETSYRGTEPASGNQTAISGSIQEVPSFDASNNPIKTTKHSEQGANSKVLKGAFKGTLSDSITIQDWRPVARVMGNTLDMVRCLAGLVIASGSNIKTGDIVTGGTSAAEGIIEQVTIPIDGVSGTIVDGEVATYSGQTATVVRFTATTLTLSNMTAVMADEAAITFAGGAAATSNLAVGQTVDLYITQFTKDETVTFNSVETAILRKLEGITMFLDTLSATTMSDNDPIIGSTSSARAIALDAETDTDNPTIKAFTAAELMATDTTTTLVYTVGTQTLYYQHQIAISRDQNSYVLNYALSSLTNQHLCKGCVMKKVTLDSAVDDAPKFAQDWLLGDHVIDATIDAEVSNSLDLYEYTDVSTLSINAQTADGTSVNWTDVLKTVNASFDRSNLLKIDSHTSLNPTGYKGATLESVLSFGIHRNDSTIWNLNISDTRFATILTFLRGLAGQDDATITWAACKAHEISEAGDDTIFLDIPVEIEGTPTIVVNDTTADYST